MGKSIRVQWRAIRYENNNHQLDQTRRWLINRSRFLLTRIYQGKESSGWIMVSSQSDSSMAVQYPRGKKWKRHVPQGMSGNLLDVFSCSRTIQLPRGDCDIWWAEAGDNKILQREWENCPAQNANSALWKEGEKFSSTFFIKLWPVGAQNVPSSFIQCQSRAPFPLWPRKCTSRQEKAP